MSKTLPSHAPAHVCIVLHQLGRGGVDRVAAILANGFATRGIRTELLVCAKGGEAEDALINVIGDKVVVRFFRQTSGNRVKDLLLGFRKMGRYLQSTRPSVVLSAGNNASMVSLLLTRRYCPRWTRLFIKTTNPVLRPHGKLYKRFFRRLWYIVIFRLCDGVLTLTDSESTFLLKSFPYLRDRLLTVSNPYITTNCIAADNKASTSNKEKTKLIVAVGRMQKQKRFDVLLQAFDKVRQTRDCRLVILGDGEYREVLEKMVISLGISNLVEMPGYVTDVQEWFSKSDLFVLSSDYEGLPAVVLEALSQNCPVVSTDCFHGVQDLLDGATNCYVIPTGDPDALADAIVKSIEQTADTSELYRLTESYQIDAAIDSHIDAMSQIIQKDELLAY